MTQTPQLSQVCRSMAERSPQAMVAVEGATHIVRYANPAFRRLLGREERDLLGRRFDDALAEGTVSGCSDLIDRVFATGSPERMAEGEPDFAIVGSPYVHWSLSMSAILGPDDQTLGVMILVKDVAETEAFIKELTGMNEALLLSVLRQQEIRQGSEQSNEQLAAEILKGKEAQEALREIASVLEARVQERTGELLRANQELQGFMYSIAHNLRTPVRAIVAASRLLVEEGGGLLTERQTARLARQSVNGLRLASLIDDLLDYARLANQPLSRRPLDLGEIVNDVASRLPLKYPDCLLNVAVEENLLVEADRETVTLLLYNLIDNAAKFSPQGGKISVGRHGETFFVRDEGVGFDMAYAAKPFEPFERLVGESEFPGNGIGLAKAKRIVELHGGTIWAESSLGHGSTFSFTLRKPSQG